MVGEMGQICEKGVAVGDSSNRRRALVNGVFKTHSGLCPRMRVSVRAP